MPFLTSFKIDFIPSSDNIQLTAPLAYSCPRTTQTYIVPAGFISDGASIPRVLWPLIGRPFDHRWRKEAVLHDFFYRAPVDIVDRKTADLMFYDSLRANGLRRSKAQAMYLGVRAGGWVAWKKNRAQKNER